jgi:hypothetical protein
MSKKKPVPCVALRDEDRRVIQAALDAINLTKLEAGDPNYLGIREDFTIHRIPPWALSPEALRRAR